MKHKMALGPCEVCPDCDGHKRVVCSCVPRNVDDVAEMVGAVGCPECDGDGDHWCPTCMGVGAVPRKIACTCDENCDELRTEHARILDGDAVLDAEQECKGMGSSIAVEHKGKMLSKMRWEIVGLRERCGALEGENHRLANAWANATDECKDRATLRDSNARLLAVVKKAWRKHHLDAQDIGWDELGDRLHDEICNAIGSDGFCDWADSLNEDGTEKV